MRNLSVSQDRQLSNAAEIQDDSIRTSLHCQDFMPLLPFVCLMITRDR